IAARLQSNGRRFPTGIRLVDAGDEAGHIAGGTRKVCSLACVPKPKKADEHGENRSAAPTASTLTGPDRPVNAGQLLPIGVHNVPSISRHARGPRQVAEWCTSR